MSNNLAYLFEEIERRGLSVAEFARQTGIKEDRVYQWKAGRGNPKGEDLVKIQSWISDDADKFLAHDAALAVLLKEVAALRAKVFGEHPALVEKQIEKAAADMLRMMKSQA